MGPAEHATTSLPDSVDIAIVGGGISGLYRALQLSRLIKDNRPANRFAGDLPTREIHYWKSRDRGRAV